MMTATCATHGSYQYNPSPDYQPFCIRCVELQIAAAGKQKVEIPSTAEERFSKILSLSWSATLLSIPIAVILALSYDARFLLAPAFLGLAFLLFNLGKERAISAAGQRAGRGD